ncbi:long-chain acyl-CoA synthetase [Streptomyces mashuensis]|uniref:Acyl-CoA synthetase n=1 Tax=Streptomyces mashuensis TaxID=33904 RepID=A0A919B5Z7_9ACTN|nr:long-chain fatty acid--CoA ligase [Streptomyces mashuensis]GHF56496.1 long-chain acyl-CoA synthetase [Streptomyces mashuensis]
MRHERPGTYARFTEWAAGRYGDLPALRHRAPGGGTGWADVTYDELWARVRAAGRGLLGLGVRPGDRVAILAETRPEWTVAQLAALTAGAVVVPVYPTAAPDEVAWVLADSGTSVLICENATARDRLAAVRHGLRHVLLLEGGPGDPVLERLPAGAPEDELLGRAAARRPEDPCVLVYTSGSTGRPKGCRLTHGNLVANQDAVVPLTGGGPGDLTYLYLPLAHIMAQLVQFSSLRRGGTLCYFGGRVEDVLAELAEVRPTHLPSVPRLFEKVHARVSALAAAQGPDGPGRLAEAVRTGLAVREARERGEEPPDALRAAWEAAERSLFAPVRALFGGRLEWALTGAAPIARGTLDFLLACGVPLYEGYGLTESSGVITLNRPGAARPGTAGQPVAGWELRIADDGEVLARGGCVFAGYHGDAAATARTVDGAGWLHTGDLGELDEAGYLTLTGRKKDLIITSAGKNIAPAAAEAALRQSRWISRAVLVGDRRPYPVALLTLDAEEVAAWAAREGVDLAAEGGAARHPAVLRLCAAAVDEANEGLARPARIRAFTVLEEDFSVAAGTLTPTLKLRRAQIVERHAKEIEAMYEKRKD